MINNKIIFLKKIQKINSNKKKVNYNPLSLGKKGESRNFKFTLIIKNELNNLSYTLITIKIDLYIIIYELNLLFIYYY